MNAVTLIRYNDWEVWVVYKWITKAVQEVKKEIDNIISVTLNPVELDILKNTEWSKIEAIINKAFEEKDNFNKEVW